MSASKTMSAEQAAERLGGCKPEWLKRQARLGKVPASKLGREWRWTEDDLDQIVAAAHNGGGTSEPTESEPDSWGLTERSRKHHERRP